MKLLLNVYDDNDNVVKTCKAQFVSIKFGVIRRLMKLLKIDDIDDTLELLRTISKAWDQITGILNKCFPDMTDDDWDNVHTDELIPVVIAIIKMSFKKMASIPNDPKNAVAE